MAVNLRTPTRRPFRRFILWRGSKEFMRVLLAMIAVQSIIGAASAALKPIGSDIHPIDRHLHPRWNGNGTNVSSLANEVGDDPVLLSQLDRIDAQPRATRRGEVHI